VWIPLADAQELLGKQGRINAILALECMCAAADVLKVREEIARILPGTKVVERGSEALARAEARRKAGDESAAAIGNERAHRAALRQERENLAAWLVPVVILAAACCIALLAFANARERRSEVALLRAVGVSSRRILTAFLAKAVVMGAAGGMLGLLGGAAVGARLGAGLDHAGAAGLPVGALPSPWFALAVLVAAPALAGLAGFLPAAYAAHQDPAEILREE
jgi:putative ABC transport system permease protein